MTESKEQTNKLDLQEQESLQSGLNRRQFIGFSASAAAALVFPKPAQADTGMSGISQGTRRVAQNSTTLTPISLTKPSDISFYQPRVITSAVNATDSYGTLSSKLEIAKQPYPDSNTYIRMFKEVNLPKAAFRFTPGPTLCVNPGDKISLDVTNNLDPNTPPPPAGSNNVESTYCMTDTETPIAIPAPAENLTTNQAEADNTVAANRPGCFNTTNLHFHGLHVSPLSIDNSGSPISSGTVAASQIKESSDDVLYSLTPGASNKYCPWLPAFHAPGTHWYHAHHHGSTGLQAAEGLAGALIVKELPGQEICKGAPDVVMIIQEEPQALTGIAGLTAQENLDRGVYERTGRNAGRFLINGDYQPTLQLQKGEIQRWRFINATSTPRAFTLLDLQDSTTGASVPLYRIAVDGITLYGKPMNDPSVEVTQVPIAPGNRMDFLVKLPSGTGLATYNLMKLPDPNALASNKPVAKQQLATIEVDNDKTYSNADEVATSFNNLLTNGISSKGKPAYLNPITTVDNYNQTPVVFQASGDPNPNPNDPITTTGRGNFRITNSKFDPTNLANIKADLGSTEEWIVANALGGAAHPFHIHVNPFQVVAITTLGKATQDIINGTATEPPGTNRQIYEELSDLTTWTPTSVAANGIDPTIWWDTFTIPKNTAVKIQHRFDDYWGNFVLHCHILIHEDQGMMWTVQINNDSGGNGANPCQQLLTPVITT